MFYKKVTSRDHKWFFLLRYGDLKEGLEMWSSRSLKWQYFIPFLYFFSGWFSSGFCFFYRASFLPAMLRPFQTIYWLESAV